MRRRCGAGEIVDLIDLKKNRMHHIVTNEFKIRVRQKMNDVVFLAGEKIIEADDIVALGDEAIAKVRAQKARAAGHENAFR